MDQPRLFQWVLINAVLIWLPCDMGYEQPFYTQHTCNVGESPHDDGIHPSADIMMNRVHRSSQINL